ncbi:cytochrome c oxidase copper chaperone 2-like [Wolffia australiana]
MAGNAGVLSKGLPAIPERLTQTNANQSVTADKDAKPKKRICCACPDTKRLRDECIVEHGEEACGKWIEAHLRCLRAEGFNV